MDAFFDLCIQGERGKCGRAKSMSKRALGYAAGDSQGTAHESAGHHPKSRSGSGRISGDVLRGA